MSFLKSSLSVIITRMIKYCYFNGEIIKPAEFNFTETFDYSEEKIEEGFKMELRDYQLRSVNWMKSVEDIEETDHNTIVLNEDFRIKFKLGETSVIICNPIVKEKFHGGILADDTGSGKTITALALIHTHKFTLELQEERQKRFPDFFKYNQSRASCIICPSNIYEQWKSEAERCNPDFKIAGLSSIPECESYSVEDIINADIVIVSYQLLQNPSYIKYRGKLSISQFHFHRLILDECHELESRRLSLTRKYLAKIRADYHWGLTGTPRTDDFFDQLRTLKLNERFLSFYEVSPNVKRDFERKFIKRNVPDLKLPEIEHETIYPYFSWSSNRLGLEKFPF